MISGLIFISAAKSAGQSPKNPDTWARWDSGHYLSIAAYGYQAHHEPRITDGHLVEWFGNTSWMPLYPILMRIIGWSGMPLVIAGKIVSELFWLLTLILLWNVYLKRKSEALLSFAIASVFPGTIYVHALFPISLTLFLTLAFMNSLVNKNWFFASCVGLAAGTSYTSSFYLTVVAVSWGVWRLLNHREPLRIPFALAALAPVCGTCIVIVFQRLQTGIWGIFFKTWEFHRYNGWSFSRLKQMLYIPSIFNPTPFSKMLVIAQSISILITIFLMIKKRNLRSFEVTNATDVSEHHSLLFFYVMIFWIAPHLSPYRISWYRAESLLLPLIVLLSSLPRAWQWIILCVWTPLAWFMGLEFFRGILM